MKILLFFFSLVIISIQQCPDNEVYPVDLTGYSYRGRLNYNNEFRIDGVYFKPSKSNQKYMFNLFFFSDGTFCDSGEFIKVDSMQYCPTCNIEVKIRKIPYCWGSYIIDKGIIKIQMVHSHRDMFDKFKLEEKWAQIVNDSTIHFFKRILPDRSTRSLNETYHFKKCTNKPDSTNVLMKYK